MPPWRIQASSAALLGSVYTYTGSREATRKRVSEKGGVKLKAMDARSATQVFFF